MYYTLHAVLVIFLQTFCIDLWFEHRELNNLGIFSVDLVVKIYIFIIKDAVTCVAAGFIKAFKNVRHIACNWKSCLISMFAIRVIKYLLTNHIYNNYIKP